MARKRKQDELDEELETTETQTPQDGDETDEQPDEEVSQLDRIEAKLDQLLDHSTPDGAVRREQALHQARHAKVPYIAPQLPANLSPNERIKHPLVTTAGATMGAPVAPMRSETEPALLESQPENETEPAVAE